MTAVDITAVADECRKLCERGVKVAIEMDPAMSLVVVSQLQLAARHPQNTGAGAVVVARGIVDHIAAELAPDGGPIAELITAGWGDPGRRQ